MRSLGLRALLVGLALVVSACDNSTTDTSTTTPAPTITETFPGTIPAPIGGTAQSAVINFNSAGAGPGTVALTSATETLSNGSLNLGVCVGPPTRRAERSLVYVAVRKHSAVRPGRSHVYLGPICRGSKLSVADLGRPRTDSRPGDVYDRRRSFLKRISEAVEVRAAGATRRAPLPPPPAPAARGTAWSDSRRRRG